ncbi:MAG: WYL domain-containing protein, partial [Desulfovibrionales bacterium]|nr:WYL domain-containing protein [Desulfovibrionales bacterium]
SAAQAKYIKERRFSPEQEIIDNRDGSVTLKMTTSGWYDVKRWLMGFGPEALVISPKQLKDEILDELQSTIDNYKKTNT